MDRRSLVLVALCGCSPVAVEQPRAPSPEPAVVSAPEPEPERPAAPEPELAALLTPEALAAAAAPEPEPVDPRTPAERAHDRCKAWCEGGFDREGMIRRLVWAMAARDSGPPAIEVPHPRRTQLDEAGFQRFLDGESSTIWWRGHVLLINPDPIHVSGDFFGTMIEIDEHGAVSRCRSAALDEPSYEVELRCP